MRSEGGGVATEPRGERKGRGTWSPHLGVRRRTPRRPNPIAGELGGGRTQARRVQGWPREAMVAGTMAVTIQPRISTLYFLCCLVLASSMSSFAEDHVDGSHQANVRLDKNMVQDKDHIMEHLEGVIDKPESEMSPQELQLHYFKMHDYDGNNLLDGLELATAISHVHKEEGGEHTQTMKDEELISLIDGVLHDDDKNNDGYIDYAEFAKSLE